MRYAVSLPRLGSLHPQHDLNAPMAGLDTLPSADRPPVAILFWSFRIMVGLGFLMAAARPVEPARAAARGKLYDWRWLHRFALVMGAAGFVAVICGWVTTEVGRQPWVVYGLLRTARRRLADRRAGGDRLAARLRHRLFHRLRAPARSTS